MKTENKIIKNLRAGMARLSITGLSVLLSVNEAVAIDVSSPYVTANRSPVIQVYGLPAASSAHLSSAGHFRASLMAEVSSNFVSDSNSNETILLDGESYRSTVTWHYGLSENWQLSASLPYISHQAGGLDSFIEDFHSTFGLPNGNRQRFPREQLHYGYSRNGEQLLLMENNAEGVGDIQLSLAYQLYREQGKALAFELGYKLASGKEDVLHGSGAEDTYARLQYSDSESLAAKNLSLHASAGVLRLGKGEVIASEQKDTVSFASMTLSWAYTDTISLKAQLDGHTAFYDSALDVLGDVSVQAIIGVAFKLNEQLALDVSLSEDLVPETAPDVIFQLGLKLAEW